MTKPNKAMKEPSDRAFAAYRAVRIVGKDQTQVANLLGVNQSTVSRWVSLVADWIAAGNVLPDEMREEPPRHKPAAMDPSKLDQGSRLDRRRRSSRRKEDD
jgi:DNA-binding transcriptional regulator YdaS (Cro superfamily)